MSPTTKKPAAKPARSRGRGRSSRPALQSVVPILVPATLAAQGKWPGPIVTLGAPGVAAAWALFAPPASLGWVTHDMAGAWDGKGTDWRTASMENLVALSEPLAPQSILREDGSISGLLFNHEDGIGPSRLLLNSFIEEIFPEGYLCAMPDRAFAMAVSKRITPAEKKALQEFVAQYYREASEPFVRGFFGPELLQMA